MFTESVNVSCSFPACHDGSAKYQTCFIFHRPSTTLYPDLGSAPWKLGLYGLSVTPPALPYTETVLSGSTSRPFVFKYLNTTSQQAVHANRRYLKGNITMNIITNLTWSLPVKSRSLQVFNHRVGNISAGQARKTSQHAINRNRQGSYSNRQAAKCVGQASLILPTQGLSVMKSTTIYGESVCAMHILESGISQITSGSV